MPAPRPTNLPMTDHLLGRELAATRVTDDVRVVCATGWTTRVHQLSGAARLLWEALDAPMTPADLAALVAVDPDDPFFAQAVDLLVEAGLFRAVAT